MDKAAYLRFLQSKLPTAELAGIAPPSPCHHSLKPHQVEICEWAIRGAFLWFRSEGVLGILLGLKKKEGA